MERQQKIHLLLGFSIFIGVIYWSTPKYSQKVLIHSHKEKPNFVFILTDDQDVVLNGMLPMRNVKTLIGSKGVTLENAFVASPLCCPSRSSILTGQYVHNHRAINNSLSGQCSGSRWQAGPEKKTFAAHLHNNRYQTFFAGKYLNQYGDANVGGLSHIPPGWDWWYGLQGNSRYYNYNLSVNGTVESHGSDPSKDYLTNVIRHRAIEFLEQTSSDKPFFMMLSVPAAHAPFTPEPKYSSNFSSLQSPRTESFNVKVGKEKHWLVRQGIQPLPTNVISKVDEVFRNRLRTLITVDDMVRDVILYLDSTHKLENTYVIFTSDNGYHLGQFSLPIDKREPYETDIRVPFMIRGPNIPEGKVLKFATTNIDLAPTFLDLAGLQIPKYMDGMSLKLVLTQDTTASDNEENEILSSKHYGSENRINSSSSVKPQPIRRTILVEHSGEGKESNIGCEQVGFGLSGCNPNFACKCEDSWNNTYACLRQVSNTENQLFCKWEDREHFEELYDLNADPYQMSNLAGTLSKEMHRKLTNLLNNLKRCRGDRCTELGNFLV